MISLHINPASGLLDEPRQIRIEGLAPGQAVTLTSHTRRGEGVTWRSQACFLADTDGSVDLSRDAPVEGDYQGVKAMGLLWSQRPEGGISSATLFPDDVMQPLRTLIEVQGQHCSATLIQSVARVGVVRREVREAGLVGTLFLPAGPGPHPAVMVLNGSGGGINEPRAALYASRGYAALALGYFKAPGLSDYISNTPLEYFQAGLNWLQREVQPAHRFIALSGQSRGGELVLLLASLFPSQVSAVIAYVPSALVHGGQAAADPAVGRDGPAWLYQGKPLIHLWNDNRTASWQARDSGQCNALSMLSALDDPEAVARARIRVERIQAPVLLLSAGDDCAWPSTLFSHMVEQRLALFAHPWPVRHLDFPNAGHSVLLPSIPSTCNKDGTPAANADANERSWLAVRDFLQDAVAALQARSETSPMIARSLPATDLVDSLVLAPDSPLRQLRQARSKVTLATQGSYDALLAADLEGGLDIRIRLLVALYGSQLSGQQTLAAHYLERLREQEADIDVLSAVLQDQVTTLEDARLRTVLSYTRTLIMSPRDGDHSALQALHDVGLSPPEVVALAQLIAFIAYQVRLTAGLAALQASGVSQ